MKEYIDQMKQTIRLGKKPSRIVSLVPSQTELLFDLGLEKEVVGITKFCIHPNSWFKTKRRVGGTKNVHIDVVKDLQPDLIIGNKEENSQEDIERLKEIAPVWMSDIFTLKDALDSILKIGEITDKYKESKQLIEQISNAFSTIHKQNETLKGKTVLYFIWNEPRLVAGKNTFIDDLLSKCGFVNLAKQERYPEVKDNLHPDFIFLSSEPYPFKEKHMHEFQVNYPDAKIVNVDGEMFSWYGSRLKLAPNYFLKLMKQLEKE